MFRASAGLGTVGRRPETQFPLAAGGKAQPNDFSATKATCWLPQAHPLQSGADAFLNKPFDVDEFLSQVAALLAKCAAPSSG